MRKDFYSWCSILAAVVTILLPTIVGGEQAHHFLPQDAQLAFVGRGAKLQRGTINCCLYLSDDQRLKELARVIKNDLMWTDQFEVTPRRLKGPMTRAWCEHLFSRGYDMVVQLMPHGIHGIRWTLYQTYSGLLLGEGMVGAIHDAVIDGHGIAAAVLEKMTGSRGVVESTLVWTQDNMIMWGDYTSARNAPLVKGNNKKFSPSWHTRLPVLFYSESQRNKNVLKMVDLVTMETRTCLAYPGLNMQLSLASDGVRGAVVLSGGKGNCELYLYDQHRCNKMKKKSFKQLTSNGGTNVSPNYLQDGSIIFCSDYETGLPQIYHLNVETEEVQRLTSGKGYCAAPAYCAANNSVVYTRPVNGQFQLFVISLDALKYDKRPRERQLTFNSGNKTEPAWHPNGTMVAFSYEFAGKGGRKEVQIALFNYQSGSIRLVTKGPGFKSFPAWHQEPFYANKT